MLLLAVRVFVVVVVVGVDVVVVDVVGVAQPFAGGCYRRARPPSDGMPGVVGAGGVVAIVTATLVLAVLSQLREPGGKIGKTVVLSSLYG